MNMFEVNEYFDGNVKSIGFTESEGASTVGVMAKGDYEFGTDKPEIMTVIAGALTVKLPGSNDWQTFKAGEAFNVPGASKFQLQVATDTAYMCQFRD